MACINSDKCSKIFNKANNTIEYHFNLHLNNWSTKLIGRTVKLNYIQFSPNTRVQISSNTSIQPTSNMSVKYPNSVTLTFCSNTSAYEIAKYTLQYRENGQQIIATIINQYLNDDNLLYPHINPKLHTTTTPDILIISFNIDEISPYISYKWDMFITLDDLQIATQHEIMPLLFTIGFGGVLLFCMYKASNLLRFKY